MVTKTYINEHCQCEGCSPNNAADKCLTVSKHKIKTMLGATIIHIYNYVCLILFLLYIILPIFPCALREKNI